MDQSPPYNYFISYADADRAWVEGYLIDALRQAGVRYHSEATFTLGVPRIVEFERAVQQSERVLLVFSPAYLAESMAHFVEVLASSYGLEAGVWPVIPLIHRSVELPQRLAMLTRLDATTATAEQAAIAQLCKLAVGGPPPPPPPLPPCPYPGMTPFGVDDSDRFYGRDREVRELLQRLRLEHFMAVIGPSGSGKSSLVFAGLVPALRQSRLFGPGAWLQLSVRPGEAPLQALTNVLGGELTDPERAVARALATQPDAQRLLLVVDQYEELFALAKESLVPFQQALLRLAAMPQCYVVLTMRADFYADLMSSPLWPDVQAHRLEIAPLDAAGD